MKSSQGSQSEERARETQMFINKNHWIDQEFYKDLRDDGCGRRAFHVGYDIFDDVRLFTKSFRIECRSQNDAGTIVERKLSTTSSTSCFTIDVQQNLTILYW